MREVEFLSGAEAIVRGALAAGCDFFAGYPITPATPILLAMMQALPRVGGIAIEGEDEIASIGMCIGAATAGRRAMTATSGPGISLYSENIGLALMAEVPLVIVDVQRMGPSTGAATTVGQGDVQFVRWGTGGGYPLIVLAPHSIESCYTLTQRAFELAERFRCPVILLTDKELNLTRATVSLPAPTYPDKPAPARPHFGTGRVIHVTGSTHDEEGNITKDPAKVEALNRHLWDKVMAHRAEIESGHLDRDADADVLFVAFGSAARAMEAAVTEGRAAGMRLSALTLETLWPVPEALIRRAARGVRRVVVAELNPGLYVREVERLLAPQGIEVRSLHRIDGKLIPPEAFLEAAQ